MTFTGKPDKTKTKEQGEFLFSSGDEEMLEALQEQQGSDSDDDSSPVDVLDSKLNTSETTAVLQNRLLKTWRDAQLSLEEQGVNVLFLALGMLEWYEAESSQELRKAPLILVPVLIERFRGVQFRIRYEGTEVGGNLSLASKLQHEFHIQLPDLPEAESLDPRVYFSLVKQAVANQRRWRVDEQAIVLGFFSYAKYLMFKDLEGTLWPEDVKPWTHEVLGALLDCGFDDDDPGISEEEHLDRYRPIKEIHEVYDADSSQALAILEAKAGRSMVIEGPPGTGKSQTITNLIAEAIGNGGTVLFVAEKRAALEVVWRNLEKAGLHEACLELHSNKTNKRGFYATLEETVRRGRPQTQELEAELQKLSETRDSLNAYCEAVNQLLAGREITPFAAMGRLLALGEEAEELRRPDFAIMQGWTQSDFARRLDLVGKIQSKVKDMGTPARNPFFGSGVRLLLPDDRARLVSQLKTARATVAKAGSSARSLAERLELPPPATLHEARIIGRAAERAEAAPPLEGVTISAEAWKNNGSTLRAIIDAGKALAQIRATFAHTLKPEAWTAAIAVDRQSLADYGERWWRFLSGKYRASLKKLRALCTSKLPKAHKERLALADAILESQAKQRQLVEAKALCEALFGIQWQGEQSDWDTLTTILDWVLDLHRQVGAGALPLGIIKFLAGRHNLESLARETAQVFDNCTACEAQLVQLLNLLQAEGELRTLPSLPFPNQLSKLNAWLENINPLQNIVAFNLLHDEARDKGIEAVADIAVSWEAAGDMLVEAFERTWYAGVLREAFLSRPALAHFDRQSHEAALNAFRDLDRLMLEFNKAKVALKHWKTVPRYSAGGSLGALQREFAKKARHKPIRKIMSEAGDAIQAIKPVFMMSPLSVAMYLPPDGPRFDLVIFDEASQIKPEDAFGAIVRAQQAIVVGDSKQMPPTSFFDKLTQAEDSSEEEEESERNVTRDLESILALMSSKIPARSPRRRDLRWHYRSKHDSLIATSNRLFYRDRLVVFPSADRQNAEVGLVFHHLSHTVYGRGGSKKNPEEARVVARAVLQHGKERPHLSLGVAAFSTAQQEAIQDELERLRTSEPALAELDRLHPDEPLFVKNLENVQGDERDAIFISIGYGRDTNGFVSMNFGPLNKEGGERRLNVLITRARVCCEVFTNLRASDIRLSETQSAGVHALRTFLHFAETGELDMPTPTGLEPMSPFEEAIIEAIGARGYAVQPQVGSAGFFVDIGVCDPQNPERFVLGIECDGAKYHSAKSARDRDRLRQEVLERRGWRIHRIWSTDWWQNRERELRRTLEAIDRAIASQSVTIPSKPASSPLIEVKREAVSPAYLEEISHEYVFARLHVKLNSLQLREIPANKMAEWVQQVVTVESPVHFEEVVRRIREAAGVARAGDPIREAIRQGAEHVARQGKIVFQDQFLLRSPVQPPTIRNRSAFSNALKKLELVHPEEIKASLKTVVEQSFGISREEAVTASLRLLGFERVTEAMRERTHQLISELLDSRVFSEQGERLKVADNAERRSATQ